MKVHLNMCECNDCVVFENDPNKKENILYFCDFNLPEANKTRQESLSSMKESHDDFSIVKNMIFNIILPSIENAKFHGEMNVKIHDFYNAKYNQLIILEALSNSGYTCNPDDNHLMISWYSA